MNELANITIATELYAVQQELATLEAREQGLKDKLLGTLKEQGVKSVKLDNGISFVRAHRETLKVKDEAKAHKWAQAHQCLKVDTAKAMQILRHELKMPAFFIRDVGADYLTIKAK